jgi:uncharacterized membrane protein YphA (DoxX/SURF4 family)
MNRMKSLQPKATLAGRSFLLNAIFVAINIIGLVFLVMGYHKSFENQATVYKILGNVLMALSIVGIIIFKGRLMMNNVARVLVGGLFIVSGLVKANDPIGFAYKLEEYFEDGALAYRIKEWFGMPEFSLEFLIPLALTFSVVICVIEIVLGVLTIFGLKMKWVGSLLLAMMLFFTFLTWHTANCDGSTTFRDRDVYKATSSVGQDKAAAAKDNEAITLISTNSKEIVIDEMKQPQCVDDCGCFGDALKGSLGRSLTPKESMWKDIVLTYFVLWIFIAAFKRNTTEEENKSAFWIAGLVVVIFFSWVFGWLFPVFFGLVALVGSSFLERRMQGRLANHWTITIFIIVLCSLMVTYVLMYDPIKDYRPYATGTNLKEKMNDGQEGKYLSLLIYKNKKSGEIKEYDASSKVYIDSKIWENTDWVYDTMTQKEIIAVRIPSITEQFNPYLPIDGLGIIEKEMPVVKDQLAGAMASAYIILDKATESNMEVLSSEYLAEDYPEDEYSIVDTVEMMNPEVKDILLRDYILITPKIILLSAKNLKDANFSQIERYKSIYAKAKKEGIPMVMMVSSNPTEVEAFRKKYNFNIPVFFNDETELKAISRSNPALLIIKKGVVVDKFPHRSTPNYDWLKKNSLK